jgi:hypothetical protein
MGLREQAEEANKAHRTMDAVAVGAVRAGEPVAYSMPATPGYDTDGNGNEVTGPADLAESDVPAGGDVPVHVAWSRVMQDVQFIAKGRDVTSGPARYKFRGIDDILNRVGPVLRKHGVSVIPTGVRPDFSVVTTRGTNGERTMNYCRSVGQFTIFGPCGDTIVGEALGEGFDPGDKSGSKASSVSLRTFYIQALAIPTDQPALDPEHGEQYELAGPRQPTPEGYAAEILDEKTSFNRLTQIKQELYGNRSIGAAEIEHADGSKERLVDLVRRIGLQRKQQEG